VIKERSSELQSSGAVCLLGKRSREKPNSSPQIVVIV